MVSMSIKRYGESSNFRIKVKTKRQRLYKKVRI